MNLNRCTPARRWFPWQVLLSLAFLAVAVGCGPSTSGVSGTVTWKGEKVKGGTLIFSPIAEGNNNPGPPGSATIQEDGSFKLDHGAVVGKNKVGYTPPSGEASTDKKKQGTPSIYVLLVLKDPIVEVKSGTNTLTIELVEHTK